jgi:hypothetical protein
MTRQEIWDADFRAIISALAVERVPVEGQRGAMLSLASELADEMQDARDARHDEEDDRLADAKRPPPFVQIATLHASSSKMDGYIIHGLDARGRVWFWHTGGDDGWDLCRAPADWEEEA